MNRIKKTCREDSIDRIVSWLDRRRNKMRMEEKERGRERERDKERGRVRTRKGSSINHPSRVNAFDARFSQPCDFCYRCFTYEVTIEILITFQSRELQKKKKRKKKLSNIQWKSNKNISIHKRYTKDKFIKCISRKNVINNIKIIIRWNGWFSKCKHEKDVLWNLMTYNSKVLIKALGRIYVTTCFLEVAKYYVYTYACMYLHTCVISRSRTCSPAYCLTRKHLHMYTYVRMYLCM